MRLNYTHKINKNGFKVKSMVLWKTKCLINFKIVVQNPKEKYDFIKRNVFKYIRIITTAYFFFVKIKTTSKEHPEILL